MGFHLIPHYIISHYIEGESSRRFEFDVAGEVLPADGREVTNVKAKRKMKYVRFTCNPTRYVFLNPLCIT